MELIEKAKLMDSNSSIDYSNNLEFHKNFSNPSLKAAYEKLKQYGVASLTVDDLGIDNSAWNSVLKESKKLASLDSDLECFADPSKSKDRKDFWFKLLGHECVDLTANSIYFDIILNDNLLFLINKYFQQYSWLMDFNIWLNLTSNKIKSSQMWHRDHLMDQNMNYLPELMPIIKVFFFIEDVNDGKGEFWFLSGSQYGGKYGKLDPPKAVIEENLASRVEDDVMLEYVDKKNWLKFTGNSGTVVIFDASGFHKGGHVIDGRRLILKSEYGSRQWINPTYPKVDMKLEYTRSLTNPAHVWAFKYPN